jgi:hypothetical protein
MSSSALEDYLAGVDPKAAPQVRALDQAIRAGHPDFDVAVEYRILMYALAGDWHTWVVALDANRKGVSLRFLYGVLLDDPRGVLRAGTSVLKTWDFGFDEPIDPATVGAYVAEAVSKYTDYKGRAPEVLAEARARAKR